MCRRCCVIRTSERGEASWQSTTRRWESCTWCRHRHVSTTRRRRFAFPEPRSVRSTSTCTASGWATTRRYSTSCVLARSFDEGPSGIIRRLMQGLADIRVIDFSTGYCGAYCTKLLADGGADVIKVEAPEGDALRHWSATGADLGGADSAIF